MFDPEPIKPKELPIDVRWKEHTWQELKTILEWAEPIMPDDLTIYQAIQLYFDIWETSTKHPK